VMHAAVASCLPLPFAQPLDIRTNLFSSFASIYIHIYIIYFQ
jgi:hypothetical protein